jgi:DNA-binding NtrC family response regulator
LVARTTHTQLLVDGDRVTGIRRRVLRVDVVGGPDRKLRRELSNDRVVIGTHPTSDVVLTDPTVSRQHCEIALHDAGWIIRDLDSTNGTWLDRVRVRDIVVESSITLRVGDSTVRIAPTDATVDFALPATSSFGALRGRSPAMRRVFELLGRVAPSDSRVLVTGESGTGKELTARAIHDASDRASGPFVVVDCGALSRTLIESALYGHERGAFTGADRAHAGAFRAANGGTLFLDEIGELPLELQPALLGAIERQQVTPLGSVEPRSVDVRIIAATNRDLRREINRGAFREDLYFRLAVVTIELPPLRERPDDIAMYVEDFIAESAEAGIPLEIDASTIEQLAHDRWPGNVRELRNTLERAAVVGAIDRPAQPVSITNAVDVAVPYKTSKAALVEQFEHAYVTELMRRHDGNITRASRAAEIDRVYLLRLLDKFGLRKR